MPNKRVLIDCDPATGVRFRDVDDGLAIILLLNSPGIVVEGITVNFGNVKAPMGLTVANKLLSAACRNVPVLMGADSRDELGKPNPAVDFMISSVRNHPGEISLLAIAPCTNVATAMLLDPGFAPNLKELIVMGGAFKFPLFSYFGEMNFHMDGKAAAIVMSAPIAKTLITMDVCTQAVFRQEHLDIIKSHNTPLSRYLVEAIAPWLSLNRKVFFRKKGFFPWDVVAAAFVIDHTLFDNHFCTFEVQQGGLSSGKLTRLKEQAAFEAYGSNTPINVPQILDAERFMRLFLGAMR